MIWQRNSLYVCVEEHASDLADLSVPVIWQDCLSVDSASDLVELPVCGGACQ